jgi:hypothetical protein
MKVLLLFSAVALLAIQNPARAQTNLPAAKPKPLRRLVLYPACPCYHVLGEGNGDTRVDAQVNLDPGERSGAVLNVQLFNAGGTVIQTASADASTGGIVGVDLHVPIQEIATFRVIARLVNGAGSEITKANTDVKICPKGLSDVEIGADGFLRVAGKREFPIGLYSAIHYEEIARAGFMVAHNYDIVNGAGSDAINPFDVRLKELLDEAWANGMRMMVEIPRNAVETGQWAQVRRRIETFRHHPGLLCWDSEERVARGKAPLANLGTLYSIVKKLDPDHPFVLGDSTNLSKNMPKDQRYFFPSDDMDAGIWWWYPIPLGVKEPLLAPPPWLTNAATTKPLWIAIQSYKQPWKHSRFPTPNEYRDLAYLSIINNVKALFFYTGSGERDFEHKPSGILNRPEEGHWDYVQKLVKELRDFSPVIMSPVAERVTMTPADAPIESATRELDGKLYLITANKSPQPQSARFTSPAFKGRSAKVLFEDHSATVDGDSLTDQFEPFGVHIYKIE